MTAAHPLLTPQGWCRLDEINVGDDVAVPSTVGVFGTDDLPASELDLLAIVLGDGCVAPGQTSATFTTALDEVRQVAEAAARAMGTDLRVAGPAGLATTYRFSARSPRWSRKPGDGVATHPWNVGKGSARQAGTGCSFPVFAARSCSVPEPPLCDRWHGVGGGSGVRPGRLLVGVQGTRRRCCPPASALRPAREASGATDRLQRHAPDCLRDRDHGCGIIAAFCDEIGILGKSVAVGAVSRAGGGITAQRSGTGLRAACRLGRHRKGEG